MQQKFCFVNDDLILSEKASLLLNDLALQRGYGIFDFLRTEGNKPNFLDDHLTRFLYSAKEMRLPVRYHFDELKTKIFTLIEKNQIQDSGIRITLTGGYSSDGFNLAAPNLLITQKPLSLPNAASFNKGIRLCTYAYQRQLPHVKTIDYLMAIWLQPFIKQQGADDVLYINNGLILECPRANIFIVSKENKILTPDANILKGITRNKVIQVADGHYQVEERPLLLNELKEAKEVFITSTTKKILPVTQVDDVLFSNNMVSEKLSQLLGCLK